MKIFPAIDIINGECVRLTKGLAENKTIYDKSPVEMAKIYQDKGFETIHVVDLDATLGKGNNDKTLELIRKNMEARSAGADMQSAYELQQMIRAEKVNEAKERMKMVIEDVLSCVPPLTRPTPVRFVKGNQHSMWIEWDRVLKNSLGNPVSVDDIKYNIYMMNSYQHYAIEDRVLVMPKAALEAIERERRIESGEEDDDVVAALDHRGAGVNARRDVAEHGKAHFEHG